MMTKPTVGIFGLTGCAGDQLVVLNCEDRLLELVSLIDIRDFLTASSANDRTCDLDVAFVEGAVLSERDERALRRIRDRSRLLVALGTCAVWGGVAARDRLVPDRAALVRAVYGDNGHAYDTQPARALHEVVDVDLRITGCPVEKHEVIAAIANLINGDAPALPEYPVCTDCRNLENRCLLVDDRLMCCGPLTVAGCNARCPGLGVPCVGCRGPAHDANVASALAVYRELGFTAEQVDSRLNMFAPLSAGTAWSGGET
jgi:sulfhydrogenase subunit delta